MDGGEAEQRKDFWAHGIVGLDGLRTKGNDGRIESHGSSLQISWLVSPYV